MRSIGLYGDSFAGNPDELSFRYHWASRLATDLGCDLTHYGYHGTSVYFSYKNFIEHYEKHDVNIFLVTNPYRYIKKVHNAVIPNIDTLEVCDTLTDDEKKLMKGWFYFSDDTYQADMKDLMVEKVSNLDPDVLLIPCFTSSMKNPEGISLCTLQQYQISMFGKDPSNIIRNYEENTDIVSGHLLPEFHQFVLDVVKNKMNTGIWNWEGYQNIKHTHFFDDIYRKT